MAKWKGRSNPINRDAGSPKVRAARQGKLKALRSAEGVAGKQKMAFADVVKIAKRKKVKVYDD